MSNLVQSEKNRIFWIDNIRWITILLVVVYHVFFYYNNIGTEPMYKHKDLPVVSVQSCDLSTDVTSTKSLITVAGVFQYFIYPWFMLLLFIVSGMCAKMYLATKSTKAFLKSRMDKLLVTSTLGVVCFHWITGYLISKNYPALVDPSTGNQLPTFVKYIVWNIIGVGHLWFCQVLLVGCLILALLHLIDKNDALSRLTDKCGKWSILFVFAMFLILIGMAQFDVIPIVTYRFCYYSTAFLIGYYIFSSRIFQEMLRKMWWIFGLLAVFFGVLYFNKFYGKNFTDLSVVKHYFTIGYGFFISLALIGVSQVVLNIQNRFTVYCSKISFGVYVLHIALLIVLNNLLIPIANNMSIWIVYLIEFIVSFGGSVVLYELLSRVPIVRYILFGMRKKYKK